MMRRLTVAAALTTVLAAATACGGSSGDATAKADTGNDATVTIRIPDPGNAGVLALGKKDGSLATALAAVHAKVAWTGSSGPFAPAALELDAGKLDIAQGSITSAVAALGQKPGFKLFAQIQPDTFAEGILVRKGSPITSIKDLVGKKVAVNKGGTAEYLLLKALKSAGLPDTAVKRVYLNPAQTAPVFNSGQVDAWAVWSSYSIPEIAQTGAHFLVNGGQIGSQNYSVFAVRTAFATDHPQVVQALYQYLHDGGVKAAQNPDAYINVFTTSGPQAFDGTAKALTEQDYQKMATTQPISAQNLSDFAAVAQFFADEKITPNVIDVKPYILTLPGTSS